MYAAVKRQSYDVLAPSDSVRALSPRRHGNERVRVCSHHTVPHNTAARIQICIELNLTVLYILINSANSHIAKTCRFEWSDTRLYVLKQAITSFRSIVIFLPFVRIQLVTVFNTFMSIIFFARGCVGYRAVEVKVKTRLRTRATQSDSDRGIIRGEGLFLISVLRARIQKLSFAAFDFFYLILLHHHLTTYLLQHTSHTPSQQPSQQPSQCNTHTTCPPSAQSSS